MSGERTEADRLAVSLLRGPTPDESASRPIASSTPVAIVLSLFIAYHAVTLLLHTVPVPALRAVRAALDRPLAISAYSALNGNPRGWGLFAPDANQANYFMKVLIEDATGRRRDLQVDFYGRRTYPYLLYDRLASLNRRVAQSEVALRPVYAAWACRDWERTHGGEPAEAAVLIRRWTLIPAPEKAYATMGYHPMGLDPNEDQETRFACATTPGGRLPDALRRRFGLPPQRDPAVAKPPAAPTPSETPVEPSRDGY
jgi:hypothetical protein